MHQRGISDTALYDAAGVCAENILTGSIRKLTRSGPNPVRKPTLQADDSFAVQMDCYEWFP